MSKPTYRRAQPFAMYLLLLISTVGAYLLYETFVVPLIKVNEIVEGPGIDTGNYSKIAEDTDHHRWFTSDAWECSPCSILRTAHGKILFSDFKAEDSRTWLVFPFSIVLERERDPDHPEVELPPIILRCEKGARLKFDQPVAQSIGNSNYTLQSAQLEGNVELYRRKSYDAPTEDLRIETSNILIKHDQIVTIDDVAFWFGTNTGMGRNLSIDLSHDKRSNNVSNGISGVNGITNIRLGYLSSMRLQPTGNNGGPDDRMLSNDNTPIEVTTAGPFEFDFLSNVARFREQVKVRKMDQFGDTLHCDELLLKFNSNGPSNVMALDAAADNEFELQSILAKGSPAVLDSKMQRARITSQLLQYDLVQQTITATDPNQVQIVKDETQFVAKSIQYRLSEDRSLGPLSASGPGQLTRFDGDKTFIASWSETLTLNRISDQQHQIRLTGNVKLRLDKQSSLWAGQVDFSIWEVPVFGQNNEFVRWSYQPNQLIAADDVHVSSEKLIADSRKLTATWPHNPTAARQAINALGLSNQPSNRLPAYASMMSVGPNRNIVRRATYQKLDSNTRPLMTKSDEIKIVVDDRTGTHELADLELIGNVHVNKPSIANAAKPELEILGESLRMIPQGSQQFQIQVRSANRKAAKIISEKIQLSGKRIFLDQAKNSMWIDGRGKVKMDNNTNSLATNGGPLANNLAKSNQLNVSFSGGMVFDGRSIYFERDVSADIFQASNTVNSSTKASGSALSIVLDRRIDFNELDGANSTANPQITEMIFLESLPVETQFKQVKHSPSKPTPVSITNLKTDAQGNVTEQFTLNSPRAVMNQIKNQLLADGPGSIEIYRRGNNGKQARGFGFVGNRSATANPNGLTYIHTKFDNQLVANTATNAIDITGNLRSVYAPVTELGQSFDPDRQQRLPDGSVRLNCQRIQLLQSDNPLSPKPNSQFIASGDAHILSDTVDSIADTISYRDDTDTLVMESTSNRKVLLKVRSNNRSRWNNQVAGSRFFYSLKDNAARIDNVDHVSATIKKAP